jgi:hypothetical protein
MYLFPKLTPHLYILDAINFADVKRRNTYIQGRPSRVNLTVLANSDGITSSLTDWCKKTYEVAKSQKELEKNMVLNKSHCKTCSINDSTKQIQLFFC